MICGDRFPVRLEETVWWQWLCHARLTPEREAIIHWEAGEAPFRWRWGDLISTAEKFAQGLFINGVRPGEVCALIIRHHRNFYPVYLGVCALGALPAVLAYPNTRLHPDKFRAGLEGMSRSSGLDWVLTERELEPVFRWNGRRKYWQAAPGSKQSGDSRPLASCNILREQRACKKPWPCLIGRSWNTYVATGSLLASIKKRKSSVGCLSTTIWA
ncbi:MAG: hypothetical protein DMC62_09120 [Verrucomicrobia bacterium]|nr:MAG: hypothetical protein DMC62_09120 [Verrucomicrobiota bacterium]